MLNMARNAALAMTGLRAASYNTTPSSTLLMISPAGSALDSGSAGVLEPGAAFARLALKLRRRSSQR